jgi:hypothetical protein
MTTSVTTVTTGNANPSYGTAKGSPLTISEMDDNLNDLSTGVNTAQATADAALPKAGGTVSGNLTVSGTTSLQAVTATTVNGVATTDWARKSTTNTFTQPQTIALTGAGTGSEPFEVRTEYNGQVFNDFWTSGAAATNNLRLITKGNNASNIAMLYNDGAGQAFSVGADPINGVAFQSNATFYSVSSAKVHTFTGGIYSQFNFNAAGGESLGLYSGPGYGVIATAQSNMNVKGLNQVNLYTSSGGDKLHFVVDAGGQHYSDSVNYNGTVYKQFAVRASGLARWTSATTADSQTLDAYWGNNLSSVTDDGVGAARVNYVAPMWGGATASVVVSTYRPTTGYVNCNPQVVYQDDYGFNVSIEDNSGSPKDCGFSWVVTPL